MPPAMKPTIRERFPDTPILDGEFVKGADGKLRYFQPIRVEIFRHMAEQIELRLPGAPYYLCMEPEAVWRRALGRAPSSDEILKDTLRWNKSTS
jgi:spore photoproduct lyase